MLMFFAVTFSGEIIFKLKMFTVKTKSIVIGSALLIYVSKEILISNI